MLNVLENGRNEKGERLKSINKKERGVEGGGSKIKKMSQHYS